ncbi:MAG: hypothetical protein IPP69_10390 [Flavobacteriales bacterium]|nr:hypothetical protein [Flavobacteriales bacterium]
MKKQLKMITDTIQQAGIESYFKDTDSGKINLGGLTATLRTQALNEGKQVEVSGIHLLIEHQDLQTLLPYPSDDNGMPLHNPIFKIAAMKEMFPGLFADPFSHRVHNIAGYLDFNEGALTNGRVMEIDGIPTICSIGRDTCVWTSKEYVLPEPISIDAFAWELATSKQTPPDSFHYKIEIALNAGASTIVIDNAGQMIKADAKRARDGYTERNVISFQITFTAKVFEDSYLQERHLPALMENIGRPLLRAINILEPIKSIYEINSLMELQDLCSSYQLFENSDGPIKRLAAYLDLNTTLVNSPNQNVVNGDIYDPQSVFEHVEIKLMGNEFTKFEARRIEVVSMRINR